MMGLLFIPAGTWKYPQGWMLIGVLFIPMFIAGLVMIKKNPYLLEKRLNVREEEGEQRQVIAFSGIMFLAAFISAGLSFRYQWLMLPAPVSILAVIVFLASYALYAEVLRENTYLSRTVEVQENQKVIDTGLYGVVIVDTLANAYQPLTTDKPTTVTVKVLGVSASNFSSQIVGRNFAEGGPS
jgi:protein-S-isoprenylcysteine O-methyltransferase Ste14